MVSYRFQIPFALLIRLLPASVVVQKGHLLLIKWNEELDTLGLNSGAPDFGDTHPGSFRSSAFTINLELANNDERRPVAPRNVVSRPR
ncbi:hypothetical protein AVEN_7951-1 [Araneus ventricosus]|uniref:Secreted protein n=1 Tax=Araneus ventricosus TaxID=182803 RepID=A0A4Y2D1X2_ARAVE|nr:hypothetical protein AVEN_7951-1 [Araneus ventricosus]